GAADTMFASDMRTRDADDVAQEVGEQHARLRLATYSYPIEREGYLMALASLQPRHRSASSITRRPTLRTRPRRWAPLECLSPVPRRSHAQSLSAPSTEATRRS